MVKCDYFSEEFEKYLAGFCSTRKNSRTAGEYCRNVANLCEFVQKDFLEIDSVDASEYFDYLADRVYKGSIMRSTVNSRRSCFMKIATYICENYPESNYNNAFSMILPMEGVKGNIKPSKIPSYNEIDAFLQNVSNPMFYLIFCLAFRVALAPGEITSLTLDKIQTVDGRLCIHFPPSSDFEADRVVLLPDDIAKLVSDYLSKLEHVDADGHLFYNKYGNPLTIRNLDRAFSTYLKASGVKTHYTLKDLRSRSILDMIRASVNNDTDLGDIGAYVGLKELRLESYVSAHTLVEECPADLVRIKVSAL